MALGAHPYRFLAAEGDPYGPSAAQGAEGRLDLDGGLLLAAEAASAGDQHHVDLFLRQGEAGRDHLPIVARALVARVDRDAAVGVRDGQARLGLEVGVLDGLRLVVVLYDHIGPRESGGRVAFTHVGLVDDIVRRFGVHEGRALRKVRLRGIEDGQVLVSDLDELPRRLGLLAALGEHDRDDVAEVQDFFACYHGLLGHEEPEGVTAGHVLGREDQGHSAGARGLRGVDRLHSRVAAPAEQHLSHEGPRTRRGVAAATESAEPVVEKAVGEVFREQGFAAGLGRGFLARHRAPHRAR